MKTVYGILFVLVVAAPVGCNGGQGIAKGPSKGTLGLDNLPPDQQIAKVQNSSQIPDRYKQLYINSVRSKQGQPPLPPGGPAQAPGGGTQ